LTSKENFEISEEIKLFLFIRKVEIKNVIINHKVSIFNSLRI
jgi:hypothetical protein